MMKSVLLIFVLIEVIVIGNGSLRLKKHIVDITAPHTFANVKIYSNLAEIIKPLGKLPLEFSADDWNDIRDDSITLVGSNVTIIQQTITEKKKSLNNAQVYVRSPSSSNIETKFIKATIIDETRNLVKLIDKDISKEPIYFTASSDNIVYEEEPPQSQYYVNFVYDTSDEVYVSYLRSNLNWKTNYQLNLFDEPKSPVLIVMADIRNDGQSRVDIEHAELLAGDINLEMHQQSQWPTDRMQPQASMYDTFSVSRSSLLKASVPSITQGEELAGLYVFSITQPFSIEGKTNYLLPMFRPHMTVERFGSISNHFYGNVGSSSGKAQRSYRVSSDRFLSHGNCIIRESNRLVGETSLPDLAAKNKHEFSIGEDADIVYQENRTLISSHNTTTLSYNTNQPQIRSIYRITIVLKNFKNRSVKIEYEQDIYGNSISLITSKTNFIQQGSTIKYKTTIPANEEKHLSFDVEITN